MVQWGDCKKSRFAPLNAIIIIIIIIIYPFFFGGGGGYEAQKKTVHRDTISTVSMCRNLYVCNVMSVDNF